MGRLHQEAGSTTLVTIGLITALVLLVALPTLMSLKDKNDSSLQVLCTQTIDNSTSALNGLLVNAQVIDVCNRGGGLDEAELPIGEGEIGGGKF